MYSSASQFDGNAAFSGGGFMPSQSTQAPENVFGISKINDAFQSSDDKSNLIVDGVDVNNVTLVGKVCNRAGRITDITFALDDGTGKLECTKWFQEAVDTSEVEGIMDGMYVRVHGHLKGFQGKRTLNIFSIRPVADFNEIASHFIDCIYVHLYNTKLRTGLPAQQHIINSISTPSKGFQDAIQNRVRKFLIITFVKFFLPTSFLLLQTLPFQFHGQSNTGGQKSAEDMVLEVLHLPSFRDKDEGVHLDTIGQHLRIPKDKLMLAIKNLIEDGNIYEAISDHYKSIVNG